MGERGWVGKGREKAVGGGGVLVMERAMRGVSMAMEKTGKRQKGMHMRRCLGGKGPVLVMVAVGSIKAARRHDQWEFIAGK